MFVRLHVSEVTLISMPGLSPNTWARIVFAAPLTVECPDGNSGCAGVPFGNESSHGFHAASGSNAPMLIAAIGRQSTYLYFASQHAIVASAMVSR